MSHEETKLTQLTLFKKGSAQYAQIEKKHTKSSTTSQKSSVAAFPGEHKWKER